jgi:beta-glucanase (GH16 family)
MTPTTGLRPLRHRGFHFSRKFTSPFPYNMVQAWRLFAPGFRAPNVGDSKENVMQRITVVLALAAVAVLAVVVVAITTQTPAKAVFMDNYPPPAKKTLPTGTARTAGTTGKTPGKTTATHSAATARPGWKLVWNDEFDTPGLVDEKKWNYEEGMLRNGEKQFYTKARKENCRVEGGMLIIEAIKEKGPGGRGDYTSASIETKGLASWTYGRIEMKAKLPQGRGTWPAFWTLGNNGGWPSCGEIDIMEFVGYQPDKVFSTLHWNAGGHKQKGSPFSVQSPFNDFHVYAVEWFPDRIDSFYDNTKYSTIKLDDCGGGGADNSFRKAHYIKINFAVGGDWGAAKGIDESIWPQKYTIDYVRVYEATTAK